MNITLTGGTGFLGAYILQALVEKGHRVRAIRRKESQLPFYISESILNQAEWVEGDVLDIVSLEEAFQGSDAIVHAAAMVSFSKEDRESMYQINRDGTANVVNMALEMGIPRLVHISSVAALGRSASGEQVNEEKKWMESRINTHYAKSKHQAEMEVWRGMGEGLSAVILNPSTILGYGDWNKGSCAIFKKIYAGFPWYSDGINGFVDVKDVARATVLLLESSITEQRYVINSDNWEFRKLFSTMAQAFGKKAPSRLATPFLSGLAWRIEKIKSGFSGEPPVLTKESARIAQSKTYFDNSKILKTFPEFQFRNLESTIREACERYANSGKA